MTNSSMGKGKNMRSEDESRKLWAEYDRLEGLGASTGDVLGRICDIAWIRADEKGLLEGLDDPLEED